MRRRLLKGSVRPPVRRAFTLVEILIVIVIVGVLISFVGVASVRAVRGARENATRTTIKKIDEMLSRRAAAFGSALSGRQLAGGGTVESELMRKYDRVPDSPMKAKRLFQKFFGVSFAETSNGLRLATPPYGPLSWTESDLGTADMSAAGYVSSAHSSATESGEMLYWVLVNGPTFGADAVEADSFSSSEVGDTDGDGLLEFIDAWGNPIRFYRWPTRLLRPGPPGSPESQATGASAYFAINPVSGSQLDVNAPATFLIGTLPTYSYNAADDDTTKPAIRPGTPLGQDGDDEFGEVFQYFFREYKSIPANRNKTDAEVARQFEVDYHTLNTWHSPLIVSAGPDGDTGLFEPTDRTNFGHLAQPMPNGDASGYSEAIQDDITNLNSRASGTGGQ